MLSQKDSRCSHGVVEVPREDLFLKCWGRRAREPETSLQCVKGDSKGAQVRLQNHTLLLGEAPRLPGVEETEFHYLPQAFPVLNLLTYL